MLASQDLQQQLGALRHIGYGNVFVHRMHVRHAGADVYGGNTAGVQDVGIGAAAGGYEPWLKTQRLGRRCRPLDDGRLGGEGKAIML